MGLMMSAYFSAIMSTADSCLMAASGNFITDILGSTKRWKDSGDNIRLSQIITFVIGFFAILLATVMQNVLELMLYSYAFMVSGLLIPVIGMLSMHKPSPIAAMIAMISGGSTTLVLILLNTKLPYELDANFFGIIVSAIAFFVGHWFVKGK